MSSLATEVSPIEVRPASLDDMSDILRMGQQFCAALDESFDRDSVIAHIEALVESPMATAFVAEQSGSVFGMVSGVCLPNYFDNSRLIATELWWWVDTDHRSKGVGVNLLHALESWAKSIGAERLSMMAMEGLGRNAVECMYLKSGYRRFETTYLKEF